MTQDHNGGSNMVDGNSNSGTDWLDEIVNSADFMRTREERVGKFTPDADDLCLLWGEEGEHPRFRKVDWMDEVARGETLLGYWERCSEYLCNLTDDLPIPVEVIDGVITDMPE